MARMIASDICVSYDGTEVRKLIAAIDKLKMSSNKLVRAQKRLQVKVKCKNCGANKLEHNICEYCGG